MSFSDSRSGVYLRYDVLTGGGFPGLDDGYYLVHEIGQYVLPLEFCTSLVTRRFGAHL